MTSIQDLIDKRANNWEHQKALLETRVENRSTGIKEFANAEDKAKWERLDTEYNDLDKAIEIETALAGRSTSKAASRVVPPSGNEPGVVQDEAYVKAFANYLRAGMEGLDAEHRKVLAAGFIKNPQNAQSVGTTAAGGYTVPPLFRQKIVERLQYLVTMRRYAETITTEIGGALPWPTNDDTSKQAYILGENVAATDDGSQDLVFGQAQLKDWAYVTGIVRASLQLLNDSYIDIEAFLARKFAMRLARRQAVDFTVGTGTNQPLGIVTGGTARVTTAAPTAIAYGELVQLSESIDDAYLHADADGHPGEGALWMANQSTRSLLRQVVDTQGHPLWQPSLQVGAPNELLGYEFVINNAMAAAASTTKPLLFGDVNQGYVIRDVSEFTMIRLNERYAESLQVGFLGFQRSDGTVQDGNAYSVLAMHV